ncbi:MAG TPA: electron transfer flavoprotein subunit alpha/FixB family protein [Bryobacteraceae bacterium]|nr:electron transfer flavoprotein subunit alpha/FixB family protein [Bryobacteraceae bacterium]
MSILAILEHSGGQWHRMSWEALAAAQQFAAAMGVPLNIAVAGAGVSALAAEAATKNAAKVYAVEHPLLGDYTADGYTAALEALVRNVNPALVVLPHTYRTRDFAPKLATRFARVLIGDVVAARFDGGSPVFVRQLFQGKLNADVRPVGDGPHFVSLQAGAWRADTVESGAAVVETFSPQLDAAAIRQRPEPPFREAARGVDLTTAERIVSVGRGIKEKENIPVVQALAEALGAELAASRPICDAGWLPMERQVGSSGQTVSPKLYLAVGISGAIQHLVGMKGAKTIVAINKDADAPIFEVADYGIVGDLFEVVPALVEEVKKAKA